MADEAELVAALHRRKLRTHTLHVWFGVDDEDAGGMNDPECPSERDPAKWWSAVAANLSAELRCEAKPWQAVRALWEEHRASEKQRSRPPLFAAAADDQRKPAFVVPPNSGNIPLQKRWTVRECREWLEWCGVRHDDVLEREELFQRVEASLAESYRNSSSDADSDYRGAHYHPPQPEPIPKQPDFRYSRCRATAQKSQDNLRPRQGKKTWYSARANASTSWDYCGCSYTGFVHQTTGTGGDDPEYCHAGSPRPGTGEYKMPGGAAPPRARAPRAAAGSSNWDRARRSATGAKGCHSGTRTTSSNKSSKEARDRKRKHNGSSRTRQRQSAGAKENVRDPAWARNVLGIQPADGAGAIKKKYYMLARKWHPDKVAASVAVSSSDNGADVAAATAKFQEIAAAYELLQST